MAIDLKYGFVAVEKEPGNPFGDNEPIFIIRGRDALAISVIQQYKIMCELGGSPQEHIDSIEKVVDFFESWQELNEDLTKVPD